MKIKLIVILCSFALITQSQTVEEAKTIFGNKKPHIGYFINPYIQISEIAGSTAVLQSIWAGLTFNNKFSLGLTYKFIVNQYTPVGDARQTRCRAYSNPLPPPDRGHSRVIRCSPRP